MFGPNGSFYTPGIGGGQYSSYEGLIQGLRNGQLRWEPGVGWTDAPAEGVSTENPPEGFDATLTLGGTPMGTGAPTQGEAFGPFRTGGETRTREPAPEPTPEPTPDTSPTVPEGFGSVLDMIGETMTVGAPSQVDGGAYQTPDVPPETRNRMYGPNVGINPMTGEPAVQPDGNPWPWQMAPGYQPPPGFRGEGGRGMIDAILRGQNPFSWDERTGWRTP